MRGKTSQNLLSASDILAAQDRKWEDVEVPEWNGTVRIKTISAQARDALEMVMLSGGESGPKFGFKAHFVAAICIDEQGNALFEPSQVEALGQKSDVAINRIYEAGTRLNKISEADVKELEKNSETGESAGSASG